MSSSVSSSTQRYGQNEIRRKVIAGPGSTAAYGVVQELSSDDDESVICNNEQLLANHPEYLKIREALLHEDGSCLYQDKNSTMESSSSAATSRMIPSLNDVNENFEHGFSGTKERLQYRCMFMLIGASCLFFWNSVLNVLYSVVIFEFPDDTSLGDTVTSSYCTMAFLSAMVLAIFGSHHLWVNVLGGCLLAMMSLAFPLICNYAKGTTTGVILLHVVAIGGGAAEMLFQTSGYAYAVILPESMAGWISFGFGICGLGSFLWWMLVSKVICVMDEAGTNAALWWQFSFCAIINLLAVGCFVYLSGLPLMKYHVAKANKKLAQRYVDSMQSRTSYADFRVDSWEESADKVVVVGGEKDRDVNTEDEIIPTVQKFRMSRRRHWGISSREYLRIFKSTWVMQVGMSFLMFLTNMCFPNIGPYGWSISSVTWVDTLTGTQQIGDFVGRYIPNLAGLLFAFLLIPPTALIWLTYSRIVLFAIWLLVHYFPHAAVLGDLWFQTIMMVIMSVSDGWFATCFMIYIPSGVNDPSDKSRASSMGCSLLILAIAIGEWTAKIWSG